MKILTKEEEDAHYSAVLRGGTVGGVIGLVGGLAGVLAASKRYHTIRNLTLPMKSFLVTSSGTFFGIIAADHASRSYEAARNLELQWYENREERLRQEELANMSFVDRVTALARREKYKIVGATWIASMIGSFVLVGRNPYLSGQQKIVQARVYAQGLTLAVLVASAAFEISDQRKGKGLLDAANKGKQEKEGGVVEHVPASHNQQQGEDLWKDMVAAEEERLKQKHQPLYEKHDHHPHHPHHAEKSQPAPKEEEEKTEEKK
ncbi:HIG1 domain-containing protein [Aspergillus clavatus NRRL 1]|uniref:Mitochondrial hypoxia responsive domain protein n=1 Tax=Aspergillus clavatus (strain ATCC 1007 / CBS 513.65 / DSM 816 / NCTC 3887 / NRRL 1 / QM 1276 / 107) TaxID=344612 RepID=A1CPN6_ASPCL|nr:mitochondrial hypoxia responsive domain protein [Aspergillus clavatus NRRL 1]EAW07607.1 mitochondrial hypoxia responsive domain protein [Aspergillus clavatus NRRL 1]